MEKYELPLVIFTVLSQMSVGITLILTLRTLQGTGKQTPVLAGKWAGSGGGVRCSDPAPCASGSRLRCPD
jgi:hypothetical protein